MNTDALFEIALALQAPWQATEVTFKEEANPRRELHLRIGFVSGSKFKDETVVDCALHATV